MTNHKIAEEQIHIATDDGKADPQRQLTASNQADDAGEEQGAVHNGVEHLSQPTHGLGHTCDLPVEPIGRSRDRVYGESDVTVLVGHEQVQKNARENQAREGDEV